MPGSAADVEASLGYSERQRVTREREEAAELEKKAQAVRGQGVLPAIHLFKTGPKGQTPARDRHLTRKKLLPLRKALHSAVPYEQACTTTFVQG